jgi:hypothetical protein
MDYDKVLEVSIIQMGATTKVDGQKIKCKASPNSFIKMEILPMRGTGAMICSTVLANSGTTVQRSARNRSTLRTSQNSAINGYIIMGLSLMIFK